MPGIATIGTSDASANKTKTPTHIEHIASSLGKGDKGARDD